jgi:hypothetical protein
MPAVIWLVLSSKERSEWTPYSIPDVEAGTVDGVTLVVSFGVGLEVVGAETVTVADAVSPEADATTRVEPVFRMRIRPPDVIVAIVETPTLATALPVASVTPAATRALSPTAPETAEGVRLTTIVWEAVTAGVTPVGAVRF